MEQHGPKRRLRSEAFRQSARLSGGTAFKRVLASKCRSSGPAFTVMGIPNGTADARLGLAVTRRQVRRAVDRNRLKRLARESFRRNATLLSGLDVVVLPKTAALNLANAGLYADLEQHWRRLVRCKGSS
jgi:ribonuclease P protein component